MKIFIEPAREQWPDLCKRAKVSENRRVDEIVGSILTQVQSEGDEALRRLSLEIEHRDLGADFSVSAREFDDAEKALTPDLKQAIAQAIENITVFHRAQMPSEIRVETMPGVVCIQRPVAIESVGIYVPGGTAPLFSTVLMLALPARIAGCKEVIMCTPAAYDGTVAPAVLYAAKCCGVRKVFKLGGAQAIAAMAYGTESVPAVKKIFGPGNRFVTAAKQMVASTTTAIDMPAGPSEVMIVADETCVPEFVASDLLSQCEHGADSQGMVVCNSYDLARQISEAVSRKAAALDREEYISNSLQHSRIVVLCDRATMLEFANTYGAEHLILSISRPNEVLQHITAAGSVFIGNYSPESAGDYASGTNHTLPTSGWAHSYSGVNIDSFMRKMTIQELTPSGLQALSKTIVIMAEAEGLSAHADAVITRINYADK